MSFSVKIENLSKKYQIFHERQGQDTLVETLTSLLKFKSKKKQVEEFWAIQDIHLDIQEGDRVGIIGRNGAGKSTLLKIMSRITKPTSGRIKIRGRVSSLLEVGTGFHSELTGRENIYLNGAILGLRGKEIRARFDEIVAFSEIEAFLDTPVKRYSSGMLTRLGFAVAAHLDPDILIVDEVLAVGDMQFQQKCLKKLDEFGNEGRTIIFVSHDLTGVSQLCNKGVLLVNGRVKISGKIEDCLNEYLKKYGQLNRQWEGDEGDEHIRFYCASLTGKNVDRDYFTQNEQILLKMELEILKPSQNLIYGIGIYNRKNQLLAVSENSFMRPGLYRISFPIDTGLFHEGEYFLKIQSRIHHIKQITTDEITLKFCIYSIDQQQSVVQSEMKDGIFLGNQWRLDHG